MIINPNLADLYLHVDSELYHNVDEGKSLFTNSSNPLPQLPRCYTIISYQLYEGPGEAATSNIFGN